MQKINAAGKQKCTNCTPCPFPFKGLPKRIFHLIRLVRGKYLPYFILLGSRELSSRAFALKTFSSELSSLDCVFTYQDLRDDYTLMELKSRLDLRHDAASWLPLSHAAGHYATRSVSAWKATCIRSVTNTNSTSRQLCSMTELQPLKSKLCFYSIFQKRTGF